MDDRSIYDKEYQKSITNFMTSKEGNYIMRSFMNAFDAGVKFQEEINIDINRDKVSEWMKSLRSGSGDYKKVYTEDYLRLLQMLEINNYADDDLLNNLKGIRGETR
jgi:hypothetical protein